MVSDKNNFTQIPLDPTDYPVWGATVYLTPSATFEYKFIRKESNGDVRFFICRLVQV